MTSREEKAIIDLVDIYYNKYEGVLSKRYIEAFIHLGNIVCDTVEELEEYLKVNFNKEYRLRRSTYRLIHIGGSRI